MCQCYENVYVEPELKDIGVKNIFYDGDNIIINFEHPEKGPCYFSAFFHFKYCPYCGRKLNESI